MSRCFPYPSPGYLRQGLVESIKLEREKVLSKTEQKLHKKREKKEKKKGRKGKDKSQGLTNKFKKLDDGAIGYKVDQLENSDLTEEHEPPVCYISDGSQNSNKRKRETFSSSECRVNGNVIKIRFSFKARESEASLSEEPGSSSSRRADSDQAQCYPWSNKASTITLVHEQKLRGDDERREQVPSSSGISADDDEVRKAALQYKALIEDWMPPLLQVKQDDDDDDSGDDWLVTTKQLGEPAAKRSKVDYDVTCASATSYPHAHFLPEAEIYALPYTVLF